MNVSTKPAVTNVEIHGNFVDGREIEAGHGEMLDVRNPATGEVIARIPNSTADDIDRGGLCGNIHGILSSQIITALRLSAGSTRFSV